MEFEGNTIYRYVAEIMVYQPLTTLTPVENLFKQRIIQGYKKAYHQMAPSRAVSFKFLILIGCPGLQAD